MKPGKVKNPNYDAVKKYFSERSSDYWHDVSESGGKDPVTDESPSREGLMSYVQHYVDRVGPELKGNFDPQDVKDAVNEAVSESWAANGGRGAGVASLGLWSGRGGMKPSPLAQRVAAQFLKTASTEKLGQPVRTTGASPLAQRVAAQWLKTALEPVPMQDGGGGEQTALPKSGPGLMVLQKNIKALGDKLEANDHAGFKSALSDLNSNFERVDANFEKDKADAAKKRRDEGWVPQPRGR